ncbi:aspartate ammonia-lyase [Clostridium botulinum]|uniref:Aspartate ammonia-lyase n=1 Tax=Clostridium botulinum TaxID=1491 RepID=A0A9Q1ZDW4_CLOBO|nr:aspartate ammonia-lyase [Clostridium botulinum]AEB75311.1 fumarate lyase [Clostridium botulinum BKT015925]KEI02298.1 aspartate ammonia-lyase [Clostridium botulinum D str. 16868]KEI04577.1 aspartate ammonia-lyase [Clostridium botulinum C/D str. Sp77]KLU75101.1 aspartate ammonia-lyase [Clostridium botulinum V891]KOA75074.1 aspartate ammonia-lyase [Clostridium botulinum]
MLFRLESDSIGEKQVPKSAYYGVQTLRASENFRITGLTIHPEFIKALAEVKKASAITNMKAGILEIEISNAITKACDEIIDGKLHDEFITDPIQGGAGTSMNMNANEVIANRAIEILGGEKGDYKVVHPNDHVNNGQSTNDVIPTAGKIAAVRLLESMLEKLYKLHAVLLKKADEFDDIIKMGRTQMQDAVPIRLGQEFYAYSKAVERDIKRIKSTSSNLLTVNLGGTAIGTGINADENYVKNITPVLKEVTGLPIKQAEDLVDGTQNLDCYVEVSGVLKACVVSLSKMANDLRLMSSGPRCGFNEINLPPKQNGSSIMPGKVNPVIPEVVSQIAFNVIGNDMTITMAAEAGQLELNAFEPVLFYNLFESIDTIRNGVDTFIENCIEGITVNKEHCRDLVFNSVGIITAICPHVGYKKAALIAKKAIKTGRSVTEIAIEEKVLSKEDLDKILHVYEMTMPGIAAKELLKK